MITEKKSGTVVEFDRESGRGRVDVEGKLVEFHATYFHSGLPARFPKSGEPVEVVFDDRRIPIEVRSVR